MKRYLLFTLRSLLVVVFGLSLGVQPLKAQYAGDLESVSLPEPDNAGGKPLMLALAERRSTRSFSAQELSAQELSNLLWAAWGINRDNGRRTVPTAMNTQEVGVYVSLKSGTWFYDAKDNLLRPVLDGDLTGSFGGAPVTILYAATEKNPFSGMHVGSCYQNAGLYCASAGLANVVKYQGVEQANKVLPLPEGYKVLILQSVGRPR